VPYHAAVLHGSCQCFHILVVLLLKASVLVNLSCELGTCSRQFSLGVVGTTLRVVGVGNINLLRCRRERHLFQLVGENRLFLLLVKNMLLRVRTEM